ncbi:RNA-binding S4 domain-containing protein [candidate division KSB1 bacterium]|nr:RNA-binding S4 domain-containing protein [candidate division KSB1 bacterium]
MLQNNQHIEFELKDEYIELVKLLKITGLFSTGGQAKIEIEYGEIQVDREIEFRKRRKIRKGMSVRYGGSTVLVV